MPEKRRNRHPGYLPLTLFLCLAYMVLAAAFEFIPWPGGGLPPAQAGIDLNPPVIRFHVLAHSDDPRDQAIKNSVRDEALMYLSPKLSPGATMEEVRSLLTAEMEKLKRVLEAFLQEKGAPQEVSIYFQPRDFPTRTYAGQVYPAGEYETFQIVLGEGQGQNWWCVMFPPLCLTELAVIPERPALEEGVREDPLPCPKEVPGGENPPLSPRPVRFRIVEWFRGVFGKG